MEESKRVLKEYNGLEEALKSLPPPNYRPPPVPLHYLHLEQDEEQLSHISKGKRKEKKRNSSSINIPNSDHHGGHNTNNCTTNGICSITEVGYVSSSSSYDKNEKQKIVHMLQRFFGGGRPSKQQLVNQKILHTIYDYQ